MADYKLYYFNARGRGEPIRQLLALGHQKYRDIRFEWGNEPENEWKEYKQDMPFGQVPVLEIDGYKMCQSFAICRYLANLYGLAGESLEEQARVDMFAETINDMRNPFRAIVLEKDPEKKKTLLDKYRDVDLPRFLNYYEEHLKTNNGGDGYFVGSKMTYADIIIVHYINPGTGYKKFLGFEHSMEEYPKLKALMARVESHPDIQKWIQERPNTDT